MPLLNARSIACYVVLPLARFSPSLGDLLSFCMPKKKVSKEKGHPTSPSMAKNAIDVTRGILPLGLKAAPTGVQNGNPAVLSCAFRK
jgi:hypothetical protein